jgi:hypothetical protein
LTATSAVIGKEQGDLLPGFVGDLSAPDHTHSSSSRALYEQKLSWIFVFIRQTLGGDALRGGGVVCDVVNGGGTAVACNSQNTKLPELRFRAWLNEEGTRQIELARA